MVSRDHESALYRQIARQLRDRIRSGHLAAGQVIGPEKRLAFEFGVSAATIGEALGVLRAEGWLEPAASGQPARVRDLADIEVYRVQRGAKVRGRVATAGEAAEHGWPPGSRVFAVEYNGKITVRAQDRTVLSFA